MEGKVVAIFIGPHRSEPVQKVPEVQAVAGGGLVGDRYFQDGDIPEDQREPKREVTIFSTEAIGRANLEAGIDVTPEDLRRNLFTEGIELDPLIGQRFAIGEVELEGVKTNAPCRHLQELANKKLLVKQLMHGGGIRARILRSGTIREGDSISLL